MDSFFGIGAPELIVILLLAGIVMGPHRIRQVAFWLGKVTAQLQAVSRGFTRQLNAELSTVDEGGEMKDAWKELQDLRRQFSDLRTEITSVATLPMEEGRKALNESRQMVENSIKPPLLGPANVAAARTNTDTAVPAPPSPSQTDAPEPPPNGRADLPRLIEVEDDPE
jgi:Sec-independent protein translocase protein TatA